MVWMRVPTRLHLGGLILRPSIASAATGFGLSLIILLVAGLIDTTKSGVFYSLLFGGDSSLALISSGRSLFENVFALIFGNKWLNKFVFMAFWALVGLIAYFLFSGVERTRSTISSLKEQAHYQNTRRSQLEATIGIRLIITSFALLILGLFLVALIRILLPYAILSERIGLSGLDTLDGWFYLFLAMFTLLISFHVLVVLLRLAFLRPRLFGGDDDAVEEELADHHGA